MPGWAGSNRRQSLPADWSVTVLRILTRDHHRCQHVREDTGKRCLMPARDVDHRIPHSEGGSDDDSNLWALCGWHHDQKTGREGGVASGKSRRAKRDAAKPLHPGLMAPPPAQLPSTARHDPPPF